MKGLVDREALLLRLSNRDLEGASAGERSGPFDEGSIHFEHHPTLRVEANLQTGVCSPQQRHVSTQPGSARKMIKSVGTGQSWRLCAHSATVAGLGLHLLGVVHSYAAELHNCEHEHLGARDNVVGEYPFVGGMRHATVAGSVLQCGYAGPDQQA